MPRAMTVPDDRSSSSSDSASGGIVNPLPSRRRAEGVHVRMGVGLIIGIVIGAIVVIWVLVQILQGIF